MAALKTVHCPSCAGDIPIDGAREVAVVERRLLLAQRDGQLAAYDLGSGDLQWSSTLGERVAALCTGAGAGAAHVTTDAGRRQQPGG